MCSISITSAIEYCYLYNIIFPHFKLIYGIYLNIILIYFLPQIRIATPVLPFPVIKSTAWLKLLSVAVTSSNNAEIKPRSRSACRSLVLYIFTSHYFMGCCVNKWLIKNVLQIAGHSYALPHAKQNCKLTTRPTTIICNKVAEEGGA